ncbi:MAG: DNA-protecting protein DprA [Armatimonadetes bacterium]|nr:DNA-protecting protein DprA [Armatimonadota bacterium]
MSPEFWQRLLATDAPNDRLWRTYDSARAGLFPEDSPLLWETLTERERQVAASADLRSLDGALKDGAVLHELDDRNGPPAVFVNPDPSCLNRQSLGVVGTRGASSYGLNVAITFAKAAASQGVTVVSGGALGIDATAHRAAIEAGGQTAVVLPCGVDVDYPSRHRDLFLAARHQGCLVSRCACGAKTQDHVLMQRNRLVAQLSDALLIVEAPDGSGSLSTAAMAVERGVPIFVVPGPVSERGFKGSHRLIREGATLVDEPEQIFEAMGWQHTVSCRQTRAGSNDTESTVLSALGGMPKSAEAIGTETQLGAGAVLSALTMLEIEGIVVKSPEGYALRP